MKPATFVNSSVENYLCGWKRGHCVSFNINNQLFLAVTLGGGGFQAMHPVLRTFPCGPAQRRVMESWGGAGDSGLCSPPHFVMEQQSLHMFYTSHHCKTFHLKKFLRLGLLAQLKGHVTLNLRVVSSHPTPRWV